MSGGNFVVKAESKYRLKLVFLTGGLTSYFLLEGEKNHNLIFKMYI